MDLSIKFLILMLIFGNSPDRVIMKPIHIENDEILEAEYRHNLNLNGYVPRPQRQVVQPTWLNQADGGAPLFTDPNVRITEQSLHEAAAIRSDIQQAVNEGRFAVDTRTKMQPTLPLPINGEAAAPNPMPPSPTYDIPFAQPMTPFQFPGNMPTFEPLMPLPAQNNFMEDMQRMWTEFMENSRKMFGWN